MTMQVGVHDLKSASCVDYSSFCVAKFRDKEGGEITLFLSHEALPAVKAMVEYFNDFIAPPQVEPVPELDPDFDDIF